MGALEAVTGSLVQLNLASTRFPSRGFESVSSLSFCSQLTSLSLGIFHFGDEEPWIHLAQLTNLKQLALRGAASGDPSPLSALTGLSSLELSSFEEAVQGALAQDGVLIPCTLSSLQPLSTLQQLKKLILIGEVCSATSLHGLAELNRLDTLRLHAPFLKSLEGASSSLTSLAMYYPTQLDSLAGIELLQGLHELRMVRSGVTSLHPLAALGSLGDLWIGGRFASLAGLEGNLCTCLHSLLLDRCGQLKQLSGIENLTALQKLHIDACGVTSLEPVGRLVGGLRLLYVEYCSMVQEEVLELPHIQPTAEVCIRNSNVKEVVLAGGVRKRVGAETSTSEEEEEVTDLVSDEEE